MSNTQNTEKTKQNQNQSQYLKYHNPNSKQFQNPNFDTNRPLTIIEKALNWVHDENNFATCYFIVIVVAFCQGILNLADISINFLYKDDFKMSPTQLGIIQGIVNLPWILKPVFGMISDCVPFFGYRRKSYLILFGFTSFLCWNILAFEVHDNIYKGITCILINQVGIAFSNVIGEALLVEISQKKAKVKQLTDEEQQQDAAKNVSLFFGIKSIGTLITAYLGGYLLERVDKHTIFSITSIFPLFLCFSATFLKEDNEKVRKTQQIQENLNKSESQIKAEGFSQLSKFMEFIKLPYIYKPIIFIFLFMITPSSGNTMFFFYTNKLGFAPEFLGELKLFYAVASILGMIIYNKFLKFVDFKKQFVTTAFGCSILGFSQLLLVTRQNVQLGIPDKVFCLGDSVILQVVGELNTMPLLVLACRLCPKNIEGTMYAVIMSTLNFGNLISSQLGGLIAYTLNITENNFDNLWIAIIISNATTILPLLFINMVDIKSHDATKKEEKQMDNKIISYYDQKSYVNILNESVDEITSLMNKERQTI